MIKRLLFLLLLSATHCHAFERTIEGKVIAVSDGRRLTIKTYQNKIEKISLANIQTPNTKQLWGRKARLALRNKVFGKQVRIDIESTKQSQRSTATVWFAGKNINRAMVREGYAWVHNKNSKAQLLINDESYAKSRRLGIWSLSERKK